MKILIVWSGGGVPAYRQFFTELAKAFRVRVLAPYRWTHGSMSFDSKADTDDSRNFSAEPASRVGTHWELFRTRFWPERSARYFVPALPRHLRTYRPDILYIMDDLDRLSLTCHALVAKLFWPRARITAYALQNLPQPDYYRRRHRLALALNNRLVDFVIAATVESENVARGHGFRGPTAVIPLWASEDVFHPAPAETRAILRRKYGLADDEVLLVFAGSLVSAKGLLLLARALPRFPRLRLFTAGTGPLVNDLRTALGLQYRHLGALRVDALRSLYQAADYAILPSQDQGHWKEQVGRFLIEAILCGVIVLGSDSGSIPELTLFSETTFRQSDVESLAELLGNLPLANRDAVRSGQWRNVQARYTAKAVAAKTAEFLGAVAGTKVGSASSTSPQRQHRKEPTR